MADTSGNRLIPEVLSGTARSPVGKGLISSAQTRLDNLAQCNDLGERRRETFDQKDNKGPNPVTMAPGAGVSND
jgi:hypothetical protein